MINLILRFLTNTLPCRIIDDNGKPYLERYYLATVFGVRFYLHRFVASDPDRGCHDHPWSWARSVVLSGWYWEELRSGVRKVKWFNKLTGDTFHRVILPKNAEGIQQPCWTLFFHKAEYVKAWGFLRPKADSKAMTWVPFNFPLDGTATSTEWWKSASKGRNEPRRMP